MNFKLKEKTKKAIRGSISLLMVIILLPMLTFSAVIVDTSRINMAKEMMSSAGDLTMNTALANYDTILKDVYGLFAMSQEKDETELAEDLKKYFADTISGYGVVSKAEAGEYVESLMGDFNVLLSDAGSYQGDQVANFLKLENLDMTADRVDGSSLANPSILRNQIVEYMKFRAPLELGMSFLDSLKSFEVADEQMNVVESQVSAQEDTQDVTSACRLLIELIREYDDLVKANNTSVTGWDGSKDGITVQIKNYPTHVHKYFSEWDENYTHINKLLLVFLAKSPSVDNVYLVKMDYLGNVYFIQETQSGNAKTYKVNFDNCGIAETVTLSQQTATAKQNVLDQINVLNGKKTAADKYTIKQFLSKSHMSNDYTAFNDEDTAINAFVGYEQFLKDAHSEVKYSDIAGVLEEIYKLGKLYEHYYGKISAEITQAYNNWQSAKGTLTQIQNAMSRHKTTITNNRNDINTLLDTYWNSGDNNKVDCLSDSKYSSIKGSTQTILRTQLSEVSNYSTYYANSLKYGSTDKYLSQFITIATEVAKDGSGTDKKIAEVAKTYVDKNKTGDFAAYIKENVKGSLLVGDVTKTDLFKLLDCLLSCSRKAQAINSACADYTTALGQETAAKANVTSTKQIYDNKVAERNTMAMNYSNALKGFFEFSKAYQRDACYYGKYIETATNIINRETAAIKSQFGSIVGNIKTQKEKLEAIELQCGTVYDLIETYLTSVDAWEKEVEAYESANGQDSFSKQARQDITTARSTYNLSSVTSLKEFVTQIRERYQEFLTYLSGDVYFKYGGKRLHEIGSAEDAKTAASSTIASISADIVTQQIAGENLTYLFRNNPAFDFVPYTLQGTHYTQEQKNTGTADEQGQLCFLEPEVIFINFLKYLNSSYPESKPDVKVPDKAGNNVDAEADYNATKEDLKTPDSSIDDMGKETEETTSTEKKDNKKDGEKAEEEETKIVTDKYGYSYKNVSITDAEKGNLPSKNTSASKNENKAFALKETDGKTNASDSVGTQKSALSGVLSGLGSAITAGIENAYILTYMFENFSYNTMIQDSIVEAKKDELKTTEGSTASLTKVKGYLKNTELLNAHVDKQKTLSNLSKNAYNNYFYGAEMEYILYGNTSPAKNVSYAKASIYAIRFAFNCIYAFTDTEIRNTTMTAGLAVQAATMGIVPYQVVQIVLQLALAAAESAMDLDMMMSGLDVVVVKTKDTWTLSISNAVKSAGAFVAETAKDYAGKAIDKAAGGLQAVLDAGADQINGAVENLKKDLEGTAEQAVKDIADQIFGVAITELETVLNEMMYVEEQVFEGTYGSFESYVNSKFTELETKLSTTLEEQFGGNELAKKVLDTIKNTVTTDGKTHLQNILDKTKAKVMSYAKAYAPSQAVDVVIQNLTDIKMEMVNTVTESVTNIAGSLKSIADTAVSDVHTQLSNILTENAGELKEGVTKKIGDEITKATDSFVNDYLGDAVGSAGTSGVSGGSSSMASLIKFGYKEYMMLFVYIGICANGDSLLKRTSDLIQLNIIKAGKGAAFSHEKGADFLMSNACSYISITATADLDMFFMDMDIFSAVLEEDELLEGENGTTTETDSTGTKLKYKGLLGY